ncbi:MAG: DUF5916 domain-containing protein [Vicinamibacterales bacterium]
MTRPSCACAIAALFVVAAPAATRAQDAAGAPAGPVIDAAPLHEGEVIALDGILDEPVWKRAVPATDFRQRDPRPGAPATERTEVRIAIDGRRLLLGVICYDSEPDRLLANQMQRDEPLSGDDRFMWGLDTYLDGRTGYFFEINPAGAMGDGLVTGPGGSGGGRGGGGGGGQFGAPMNKSWDGIWIARVRRNATGWTAEVEIPFRTLNLNAASDEWGVNFQRTVRRKNEESLWTGWQRTEGLLRMSNAGRLRGVHVESHGLGLEVKPYGIASVGSAPGSGLPAATGDASAGMDVFYNVTPGLRANFTVNTDFAETEVDQRRTNLTRFPLFFPERRGFFLEGSSFFDFPPGDGSPFFSRRIGLNDGQPQRVLLGAKLTGQIGQQDVGVLHVRTGEDDGAPGTDTRLAAEDFTALRLKRRLGRQSFAGLLYTRRAGVDGASGLVDQHTLGYDVTFSTPSFLGSNKNFETGGYFIHTTGLADVAGGSNAYGARVVYNNEPLSTSVFFREVDPAYDAAVGFTPRVNFRRWNSRLEYAPRINRGGVRELQFGANMELSTLPDNTLITRQFFLTPLEVLFESGDRLQAQVFQVTEQLEVDFEIDDGILLPFGSRYAWRRQQLTFDSAENRPISTRAEYSFGDFYSGSRREFNLNVRLRPKAGVYLQATTEFNDVHLAEGAFTTKLYRLDGSVQFSPWISLTNNVQFDTQSQSLGWQMRFRWIRRPGNDLFVVYTHNWLDSDRWTTLDRKAAVKLVQTFRF